MNTVSGSTNLWRLFGEHKPLDALHWWCEGLLSGLGAGMSKNGQRYDLVVHFAHFCIIKLKNKYRF